MQHFIKSDLRLQINNRQFSTIVLLCGVIVLFFIPHDFLFDTSTPPLCIHKRLFGFDCPGCGMTRAMYSFLHLQFYQALKFNPAVILVIAVLIIEIILTFNYYSKLILLLRKINFVLLTSVLTINYFIKILIHFSIIS
jgi:hypothetical protein